MAPRFKQNMYQTYTKDIGADALICFSKDKFIFPFRDKLTEKISNATNLHLNKNQGEPTEVDSWFSFFHSEHEMIAKEFFSKKYPGFFAWLFKPKRWKEYKEEEKTINKLVRLELSTSHDHSCIELVSSIHSEELLSELIESVANELQIDMLKNPKLPAMGDIIMTNKTFDIKT